MKLTVAMLMLTLGGLLAALIDRVCDVWQVAGLDTPAFVLAILCGLVGGLLDSSIRVVEEEC